MERMVLKGQVSLEVVGRPASTAMTALRRTLVTASGRGLISRLNHAQQLNENPKRQAPDGSAIHIETGHRARLFVDIPFETGQVLMTQHRSDISPVKFGDFFIELIRLGFTVENVNKGSDRSGAAGDGHQRPLSIQCGDEQGVARQVEPNLLDRFAFRGVSGGFVIRFNPSTGKSHVTGPGISDLVRTFDEQNLRMFIPLTQYRGNSGARRLCVIFREKRVKSLTNFGDGGDNA